MRENETFPGLTGLRFVLALWIAVYHLVWFYGPKGLAEAWWIQLGNARVDVFFALSGFVLAHVYALKGGTFDFGAFFKARVARLYPLHLLGLAVMGLAVVAAFALGKADDVRQFTLGGLFANVFMLQAWGLPGASAWNFPVWTLSAEMFAYFLFPLVIVCAPLLRARPRLLWIGMITAAAAVGVAWPLLGTGPLADATNTFGAARGALGFFTGVAARFVFERTALSARGAMLIATIGAVLAGLAAVNDFGLWAVATGATLLVIGVAGLDRAGARSPLMHPVMLELGRWSYAFFALHIPVFVILTRVFAKLGMGGEVGLFTGAVMVAVALALAGVAHYLVEEPARVAIRSSRLPRMTLFQKPANVAN